MQESRYSNSVEKRVLEIINSYSIRERKYITIDKIQEKFGGSKRDIQQILDMLVNKNVLMRKFIFACPNCSQEIEVKDMSGVLYECDECNTSFNPLKNRRNLLDIVYEYKQSNSKRDGISYTQFFNNNEENNSVVINFQEIKDKCIEREENNMNEVKMMKKIFISHSTIDKDIVAKFIRLLKDIGIPRDREHIFCSSYPGLGVEAGDSIPIYVKNKLEDDALVIFMFSESYYKSPYCLCEMGATWIKANEYLPLVIPPFKFKAIEGFIDNTKLAIDITSNAALNELKDKIIKLFNLPEPSDWEGSRNEFISDIQILMNR